MSLRIRNSSGNEEVIYDYPNISDLNGTGISTSHRLVIRRGGSTRYIGLTTDSGHQVRSSLRIRVANTNFWVTRYSKNEDVLEVLTRTVT